eukprot:2899742-Rhodomonas_salina.2
MKRGQRQRQATENHSCVRPLSQSLASHTKATSFDVRSQSITTSELCGQKSEPASIPRSITRASGHAET